MTKFANKITKFFIWILDDGSVHMMIYYSNRRFSNGILHAHRAFWKVTSTHASRFSRYYSRPQVHPMLNFQAEVFGYAYVQLEAQVLPIYVGVRPVTLNPHQGFSSLNRLGVVRPWTMPEWHTQGDDQTYCYFFYNSAKCRVIYYIISDFTTYYVNIFSTQISII